MSPMHLRTCFLPAAAAAALVALLSACGSAGSSSPGTAVTTVPAAHSTDGRTIAPAGSPYRYTVPTGFVVVRHEIERGDQTRVRFPSMVALGRFDVISVKVLVLPGVDAGSLPGVAGEIGPQLRASARATGARMGRIAQVSVAGHTGLRYTESNLMPLPGSAPANAQRTMIFGKGYAVVVSCQWTRAAAAAAIRTGCGELQSSLVLR